MKTAGGAARLLNLFSRGRVSCSGWDRGVSAPPVKSSLGLGLKSHLKLLKSLINSADTDQDDWKMLTVVGKELQVLYEYFKEL